MATGSLIHHARQSKPALVLVPQPSQQIRRIFNNDQIIERFDKWLLAAGLAANTRLSYTGAAKQLARFLVDKPFTALMKEDVRAFIGNLYAKGMAATTIQTRLHALRALGDCLQLGGQVRASVPRYILTRKLPKRLPHAISEEDMERIILAARTPRDLAILELAYASGLRVSELAALRVEDINLKAESLLVRQGKGGKDRIDFFGRPAAAALKHYIGNRTSGPLFLQHPVDQRGRHAQRGGVWLDRRYHIWFGQWREADETGKHVMRTVRLGDYEIPNRERARQVLDAYLRDKLPEKERVMKGLGEKGIGKRTIYRVIVAAAKCAGISGVAPHCLRHSMATHCLSDGMDIRYVQALLGHSSPSTTTKYLHVATANLLSVHRKFFPRG